LERAREFVHDGFVDWFSGKVLAVSLGILGAGRLAVDIENPNMRSKTRLIIFVTAHALLCGCGRLSGPDAVDADADDRAGLSVRGPEIVRFDGFEGDSVASFWRPGNAGDGRYAPGAVAISADYARTGTKSVRIIVR
jgi:hypothetical protein